VCERRHIGNLRRGKDRHVLDQPGRAIRVLASQGKSRKESEGRIVVILSGYNIRKKNLGVEKDSNTDKRSIMIFPRAANDVRSLGVGDK
jgi:hypothetical protein